MSPQTRKVSSRLLTLQALLEVQNLDRGSVTQAPNDENCSEEQWL